MTTEHSNNQQFIHWSSAQVALTWREAWVQRPGTQPECLASTEHWQPLAAWGLGAPGRRATVVWKHALCRWPLARNLSHWLSLSHTLHGVVHAVTVARSLWGQSVTGRLQGPATSLRRVPDAMTGSGGLRVRLKFHWQVLWVRRGNLKLNLNSESLANSLPGRRQAAASAASDIQVCSLCCPGQWSPAWLRVGVLTQAASAIHLEKRHPGQVRITRDIPV